MIEDSATLEGESAIPLEGIALGVDHLEALVVFLLSAVHTYATWIRPHATLSGPTIAAVARDAYFGATTASAKIDPEGYRRREAATKQVYPSVTIEDPDHVTVIHRVRSFGVAIVFEREVPLGLARAFAHKIIGTLEHDLPYVGEAKSVSIRSAPAYEPPSSAAPPVEARSSAPAVKHAEPARAPSSASIPRVSTPPLVTDGGSPPPPLVRPPERVSAPPAAPAETRAEEPRFPEPLPSARPSTPKPPPVVAPAVVDDDAGPDTGRSSPPERFSMGPDTIARPGVTRVPDGSDDEVAPSSIHGRARKLVALLVSTSVEPHIVLVRLGLRTGLGLEPLMDPKSLNAEALMLIETAAEDMLGVDHDGLQSLLQRASRGAAS